MRPDMLSPPAPRSLFLGLGANLGNREANLRGGLKLLQPLGLTVVRCSRLYESEPVGCSSPFPFLNLVVQVITSRRPREILHAVQRVEARLGRAPAPPNAPRPLDIDLLLDGNLVVDSSRLRVPHPRLHLRRFVLVPLAEIAPDVRHPVLGATARELLRRCSDRSRVVPWSGEALSTLLPSRGGMYDAGRPGGGAATTRRGRPKH